MIRELKKQGYIDALRGYAILGVLLVHSAQQVMPISPALKFFRDFGIYGVQLFYVVSAFALFMSWNFRSPHEHSPTRNFFLRRFFRIAPMFYLAIPVYLLMDGLGATYWAPNGIAWWQIVLTALFGHGLHPEAINAIVPGGWSVAVEMCFYLLLPFLFRYIENLRHAMVFLAISLVVYVLSQGVIDTLFANAFPPDQQYLVKSFKYQNFLGQLPVFAMGIVAYFLGRDFSCYSRFVKGGVALLVLMVMLALFFPKFPVLHNHLYMGAMLAIFTFVLTWHPPKLIANRFIVFVGTISYSMYLTQFVVIFWLRDSGILNFLPSGDLNWFAYFLLITSLIMGLSWITHRYIEQPGIRLGRRLIVLLEHADERRAAGAAA